MDALRKQVKEEMHSKTVMAARISSDSSDLVKNQADTKQKKEKVSVFQRNIACFFLTMSVCYSDSIDQKTPVHI